VDGQSLKYDPKVGFKILKIVINPSQSVSLFQCRTNTSINDRVDIAVLPPRGTKETKLEFRVLQVCT
jgi:hypothetical protein